MMASFELSVLYFLLGIWPDKRHPKDGSSMPELWVGDDLAGRVLVYLRERSEDLLGPIASFILSGLGLLVGIWKELSLKKMGERYQRSMVSGGEGCWR